jgi:hypothetical protein
MGYWVRDTCGSTYFFSNTLASAFLKITVSSILIEKNGTVGYVGSELPEMLQHGVEADCV